MAKNKKHDITPENVNEWLGSTGFLFPRNRTELARFEKLYSDFDHKLSGEIVDPEKIIKGESHSISIEPQQDDNDTYENWKMAARKFQDIPDHIIQKMKKNQDSNGNSNSEKEEN